MNPPVSPITTPPVSAAVSGGGVAKAESMGKRGRNVSRNLYLERSQLLCLTLCFLSLAAKRRRKIKKKRRIEIGALRERGEETSSDANLISLSREGKANERERKLYIFSSFYYFFLLNQNKYLTQLFFPI